MIQTSRFNLYTMNMFKIIDSETMICMMSNMLPNKLVIISTTNGLVLGMTMIRTDRIVVHTFAPIGGLSIQCVNITSKNVINIDRKPVFKYVK